MLSLYSWDNIAQVKALCNVVQCCPRNSRKHSTGKNPVQCFRNTTGQHCTCKNPMFVAQAQLETPYNIAQDKTKCNVV